MRFGSVCSGIEAASVAWHGLGWSAAWLAEIDPNASKVLAHRFPSVVNHGDMTKLAAMVLAGEIEAPDILVGGTPCQAFSVAGLRAGLADARGQLTLSYVDLANAIDRVRRDAGKQPCIVVWENVPGVLSDKSGAFGCFLAGLAGEDDELVPAGKKWTNAGCVLGPERAVAWRTLDAQYFGLAQRRRRVFVVASSREGFDPAAVLLEFEGVSRDSAPRRGAGEDVAGTLDARTTGGGFPGTDGACSGHVQPVVRDSGHGVSVPEVQRDEQHEVRLAALRLVRGGSEGDVQRSVGVTWPAEIAATLNASFGSKQGLEDQHINGGASWFVPHPVAYAFQPRIARNGRGDMGDVVNALTAQAGETGKGDAAPCVAYAMVAFTQNCRDEVRLIGGDGQVAGALSAQSGSHQTNYVAVLPFDTTQVTSPSPDYGDPCHPLAAAAHPLAAGAHPPAVCVTGDITHCLKAEGFDASEDGTGRGQPIVPVAEMAVRRLMPVETERLQGFPDNWTLVPSGNRMAADGPRYKQCGNSMAVDCMRWIGRRIKAALPGDNGGPLLDDDFAEFLG